MNKIKTLLATILVVMSQFVGIIVNAEEIIPLFSSSIHWSNVETGEEVIGVELEKSEKQTIMLNDKNSEGDIIIVTTDSIFIDVGETNQLNQDVVTIKSEDDNHYRIMWKTNDKSNQVAIVFIGLKEGKGEILVQNSENSNENKYQGKLMYEVLKSSEQDQSGVVSDKTEGDFDKTELSMSLVDKSKDKVLTGEKNYYYMNVSLSGIGAKYSKPYQIVTLSKSIIDFLDEDSIGTSESIDKIELTEDDEHYYIKIGYKELTGGTAISVPIELATKNYVLANDEEYSFNQQLYTENGILLSQQDSYFKAKTNTPVPDISNRDYYVTDNNLVDESIIKSDYQIETNRGIIKRQEVNFRAIGTDRRNIKITIFLNEKMEFDTEDTNYIYDKNTHTVTTILTGGSSADSIPGVKIKSNGLELKEYQLTATAVYLNDDGTPDMASEEADTFWMTFIKWIKPPEPGNPDPEDVRRTATIDLVYMYRPTTYAWDLFSDRDLERARKVTAIAKNRGKDYWSDKKDRQELLKQIDINFEKESIVTSYSFSYQNKGNSENLKGIDQNTLYGVTDAGTEVIAENIQISDGKTYTDIPVKKYSSIYLTFSEELNLSKDDGMHELSLSLQTKMTTTTFEEYKESFSKNPDKVNILGATAKVSSSAPSMSYEKIKRMLFLYKRGSRMTKESLSSISNLYSRTPFTLNQKYSISRNEMGPGQYDFNNLKYTILLPDGYEYIGLELEGSQALATQVVNNFKGTEKTAVIIDLDPNLTEENSNSWDSEWGTVAQSLYRVMLTINPQFIATKTAKPGISDVITYLSWGNNESAETDILGMHPDEYDLNENGDTTDLIAKSQSTINLIPGKELHLSKKSREQNEETYRSNPIVVDGNEVIEYELSAFNNSIINIKDLDLIDILPYRDDTTIVPNDTGEYNKRGSDYQVSLTGPLVEAAGYNFIYSTDVPKGTIEENKEAAKWVTSDEISDFSKVTMIRIKANQDTVLNEGKRVNFYYSAKIPSADKLKESHKAVNSFAAILNNDSKNSLESLATTAEVAKYKVEGTVYKDKNKNSMKDESELGLADYKVEIFNNLDKLIATANTNKEGHYSLDVDKAGDYKVKITTETGDEVSEYKASTNLSINNDFNKDGEGTVTLEKYLSQKLLNMAISDSEPTVPEEAKVIVHHVDETGTELIEDEILDGTDKIGEEYQTASKEIVGYELRETPTNANGKYVVGTIEVTYVYGKIKEESSQVITHYVDEESNQLIEDEILDGTGKIGEEYETTVKEIAGYELKETPENAKGKYIAGITEVTYVYKKIKKVETANVLIHHVDESGVKLSEDEVLDGTGKIGEEYQTASKEIASYELKETPKNAKGKYVVGTIEVTYVYKKIEKVETSKVIVHHVDESGVKLKNDEILDGTDKIGEKYQTSAQKIAGYELKETPKNAKGNYVAGTINVTYVYKKAAVITEPKEPKEPKEPSSTVYKNDDRSLPQTGEKIQNFTILSLVMISLSILVYGVRRKNNQI